MLKQLMLLFCLVCLSSCVNIDIIKDTNIPSDVNYEEVELKNNDIICYNGYEYLCKIYKYSIILTANMTADGTWNTCK